MSVLDRLAKQQAARPQNNQGGRVKGIYHQWKEAKNIIRLAGDYTEVRTHFIAPAPKRSDRGLCIATAFQGDERLPQVVNCLNWDIALERPTKVKTCPICKLNAVARAVLNEKPSEEEKKFFEALRSSSRASTTLKWNIIDRDDPFVIVTDANKAESKVLGYKIASIGPEASADIFGIFKQVGYDINDPVKGVDIEVVKDSKGVRTTYSARAVISGTSLKVTPLTKEEAALELHDLKVRCGKLVDADKLVDALHEDLREIINLNVDDDKAETSVDAEAEAGVAEVSAPAPAPASVMQKVAAKTTATAAPAAPKAAPAKTPTSVLDRFPKKAAAAPVAKAAPVEEAVPGDDEDAIPDDAKKK